MERDDRIVNARQKEVEASDIAVGVVIGRTFRNSLISLFTPSRRYWCFPNLVFPGTDPLTATLYSFAIFSLASCGAPHRHGDLHGG